MIDNFDIVKDNLLKFDKQSKFEDFWKTGKVISALKKEEKR